MNHPLDWKYVTETDAARYLRQAKLIDKVGHVPAVDSMRYHPTGWKSEKEPTLVSHFIFICYKIAKLFHSDLSIEAVGILYPPICFGIGLIVFYLLGSRLLSGNVALISVVLLALSPGALDRTVAGFTDKDGLTWLLGLLLYYFYVRAYQTESGA